jgi:hypothetical protein
LTIVHLLIDFLPRHDGVCSEGAALDATIACCTASAYIVRKEKPGRLPARVLLAWRPAG